MHGRARNVFLGCCLTHVLELDVVNLFGRSFVLICEFELKTFCLEKLEERFLKLENC